jgi:hypothetical protein
VPLTPSVVRVAEKVEKASETSMLRGALSTHRLLDLGSTEVARKRRKEESSKVIQKYSEIRVHHTRKQIKAEEEEENRVVNMQLKRLKKGWRKQYNKVLKELKQKAFLDLE